MQPMKKFLNVQEIAEYLGVSEDWVYHRFDRSQPRTSKAPSSETSQDEQTSVDRRTNSGASG